MTAKQTLQRPATALQRLDDWLAAAIEWVLLATIFAAPWWFGCVHARFEFWLGVAVALMAVLCGIRAMLLRPQGWQFSRTSLILLAIWTALILIVLAQSLSLPTGLLNKLSPATDPLRAQLIPEPIEALANEPIAGASIEQGSPGTAASRSTASLNPGGSQRFAVHLLGLLLVFCSIATLPKPSRTLYRLSTMAVVLGTCLALFAIAQSFGGPPNKMYWYFSIQAPSYFGMFINRNHFPFLMNLVLGLSVGLLLRRIQAIRLGWLSILHDVRTLWLLAGIAFMLASVLLSWSRGGMVALAVAGGVVAVTQFNKAESVRLVAGLLLVTTLGIGLIAWFGFELVSARLSTLTLADTYREDGRWSLWQAAFSTWMRFPILGSGGETFRYWETILQPVNATNTSGSLAYRADNEFLDVASEYGSFALACLLMLVAVVLRQGFVAARRSPLAAGAFMSLVAVSVHSCLDFGLRIPATGVLAAAIAALVCSSGNSKEISARYRHFSVANVGIGLCCVLGGLLLVNALRKSDMAERWRQIAYQQFVEQKYSECVSSLQNSIAAEPDHNEGRIEACRTMLAVARLTQDDAQRTEYIQLAKVHLIEARRLCPLAWEPHLWLAEYSEPTSQYPGQEYYLRNARFLHPSNEDIAYLYGASLNKQGEYSRAWEQWRAALSLSAKHFEAIIASSSGSANPEEFFQSVLPDDPKTYLRVAKQFSADESKDTQVRKLLARTLELLAEQQHEDRFEMEAECQLLLGEPQKAIEALTAALAQHPNSIAQRIKLAELQIQTARTADAIANLRRLLIYEPDNARALQLLKQIEKTQ